MNTRTGTENGKNRLSLVGAVFSIALILFMLVTVLTNRKGFEGNYDSLVGFTASNFSGIVTREQSATVIFKVSEDHLGLVYTRFTPVSEASLDTRITVKVESEDGEALAEETYRGMSLYMGQYQNIPIPPGGFEKGRTYVLSISGTAADEDSAYRLLLGSGISSDVVLWDDGTGETGGLVPELHTVYSHHF